MQCYRYRIDPITGKPTEKKAFTHPDTYLINPKGETGRKVFYTKERIKELLQGRSLGHRELQKQLSVVDRIYAIALKELIGESVIVVNRNPLSYELSREFTANSTQNACVAC